jgi:hypothetical protein
MGPACLTLGCLGSSSTLAGYENFIEIHDLAVADFAKIDHFGRQSEALSRILSEKVTACFSGTITDQQIRKALSGM